MRSASCWLTYMAALLHSSREQIAVVAAKQVCDHLFDLGCTATADVERPLCRELTAKLDAEKGITDNPLLAENPEEALEPAAAAPDADAAADAPAEANGALSTSEPRLSHEQQVRSSWSIASARRCPP